MSTPEVLVSVQLGRETHLVGQLWFHSRKGRERASFEYNVQWRSHSQRFALEPALALMAGTFHTSTDQRLFGALGDSAPDRWGRILMGRAERARARAMGEAPRSLSELDYLLGVHDEARLGALRFSLAPGGPYLSDDPRYVIPPLLELPRLLTATERFLQDDESAEDLRLLLAPGSSLGGARPKASVRDLGGQLAMAKFPRKDDEGNVVIWEAVALALAKRAGLEVPHWRLDWVLDKPTLILRRFDRRGEERVPFLSAMSMLGARDNEHHSYLEIGDAIRQHGAFPDSDLANLWRRIVFFILISNTDDHLRNHGFIYEQERGWRLSPVYDVNPTPIDVRPRILTTAIDLDDGTASLDLALSVAEEFRLSPAQAREIISEVRLGVSQWGQVAGELGLGKREIDRMASAFEHEEA